MGLDVDPLVSRHHGLLGTVIELRCWAGSDLEAAASVAAAVAEVERLQAVFDRFDPSSGLRRWGAGSSASSELTEVLDLARGWRIRSDGAFDPAVGRLVAVWDEAAGAGRLPSRTELEAARRSVPLPAALDDASVRPWVDLNAIAKGWIVDRALAAGLAIGGTVGLTVNAGGDVAHHHERRPLVVGIEDPGRPFDNASPLTRVRLHGGAVATSGGSRRGWTVGGRRFSHVLDPRTGWPVSHVASASVVAPDAATADVVATVLTVLEPGAGLAFLDGLADVGCFLVTAGGELVRDPVWAAAELSPG